MALIPRAVYKIFVVISVVVVVVVVVVVLLLLLLFCDLFETVMRSLRVLFCLVLFLFCIYYYY